MFEGIFVDSPKRWYKNKPCNVLIITYFDSKYEVNTFNWCTREFISSYHNIEFLEDNGLVYKITRAMRGLNDTRPAKTTTPNT